MTVKATTVPGIGKLPASLDPQTRQALEAVIEAVEIRLGRKGDPIDRAVTLRELIDSGLALRLKAAPFDPNNYNSANTGLVPVGGVPTEPYAPIGFTATGAYSSVNLIWQAPFYKGHNQTEIFRSTTNNLSTALATGAIGVTTGRAYNDQTGGGFNGYYWIRFVNTAGVRGPFNSPAGTQATTAIDIDFFLALLTNQITSSQLATDLATPIASIPSLANSSAAATSAAAAATSAASAATNQVSALADTVAALQNVTAWASGQNYAVDDQVTFSGGLFSAISAHVSDATNGPTSGATNTRWLFLGTYTSLSSAVAGNSAGILDLNTLTNNSNSVAARKISALDVSVNDPTTGLNVKTQNIQALTNEVFLSGDVNQGAVTALSAVVNNATTGVAVTAQTLSAIRQNIGYDGATQQSKVDSLEALLDDGAGSLIAASAISTLLNEIYPNGLVNQSAIDLLTIDIQGIDGSTAQADVINALKNQIFPSGDITQSALTSLKAAVEKSDGTVVESGALDALYSNIYPSGASGSSTLTQLENRLKKADGTFIEAGALSKTVSEVYPDGTSAASSLTALNSGFTDPDGTSSTVSLAQAMTTQRELNGDLKGQYSVKIDVNGHVAGFGLSNTLVGDTPSSAFIIRADRFALIDPNSANDGIGTIEPTADNVPFIYTDAGSDTDGNSWPAGVYMKMAYIRDAEITNAKIKNISADKITTGNLDVTQVLNANQIDVTFLNLVGSGQTISLSSSDTGARMIITGETITIFDALDTPRVKLGAL